MLRISPYAVRMRKNTEQNNSEYGKFSRCVSALLFNEINEINFRE